MEKGEPRFPWVHLPRYVVCQGSRIDRVYTDIKIANNTKNNHIIVSFTNNYNAISIDRLAQKRKLKNIHDKRKLKNIHDTLIILFYVSPKCPQLQRLFFFY